MTRRRRPGSRARVTAALAALGIGLGLAALPGCATTGSPLPRQARPLPPADGVAAPARTEASAGTAGPSASPGPSAPACVARASMPPLATLPPPGARGSRIEAIRRYGYLRVGVTTVAPPFGSMNWHTMEVEGFDPAIAREIARVILGDPDLVQIRAVDTRDRESLLADGTVDIVAGTMTMTCLRKERVRFSGVYYEAAMRILVTAGAGLRTVADLAGRPVCSSQGSTSFEKIANLVRGPGRPIAVNRVGIVDCLAALQRGEVDAVATDDTILAGMRAEDATVTVLGPEAFDGVLGPAGRAVLDEPYGVAIARTDLGPGLSPAEAAANRAADDDFVAFVNRVLLDLMTGPTWNTLYNRYLRDVLRVPGVPPNVIQPNWPDGVLVPGGGS
ncbi:transporter substrate-binding domain-containing protein [Parafrankia discariae]|uniref:transporter substrate-binding domain-containing protein n=1 Tax=Parafrankia discariae TaxID=365528 RepID=UPI0003A9E418|nr:transporter substrate-binding domain-containing protein [Parafrankia discariae]